jgi:hypothetical protein
MMSDRVGNCHEYHIIGVSVRIVQGVAEKVNMCKYCDCRYHYPPIRFCVLVNMKQLSSSACLPISMIIAAIVVLMAFRICSE